MTGRQHDTPAPSLDSMDTNTGSLQLVSLSTESQGDSWSTVSRDSSHVEFSNEWRFRAEQAEIRVKQLQCNITKRRQEVAHLEGQLQDLKEQMSLLTDTNTQLLLQIQETTKNTVKAGSQKLEQEIEVLQEHVRCFSQDIENESAEKNRLKKDVASMTSRLEHISRERDALKTKLAQNGTELERERRIRQKQEEESNRLRRQLTNLQKTFSRISTDGPTTSQVPVDGTSTPDLPEHSAVATSLRLPRSPVAKPKVPFDLKWSCKKCTFENTKQISKCEMCGNETVLPLFIDGYEVTTPQELAQRQQLEQELLGLG